MKKNTRNLIIGLVVILILAAAAIVLALTGGQEEGESSSAASTESYSLIDKTKQDLATMEITNEGGTYTIRLEEKIVEASSEASSEDSSAESGTSSDTASSGTTTQWVYSIDGVADYLADTTKIENAARYGYSLSASKNLGKVEDLEEFGLAEPAATVSVTYRDGTTAKYKVGNTSGTDSAKYYVQMEGDENVYIAMLNTGLLEPKTYYTKTDILSISPENEASQVFADSLKLYGTEMPEEIVLEGRDDGNYYITSPKQAKANVTKVTEIVQSFTYLSAESVAATSTDEETLKEFGLLEPAAVAELTVSGKTYIISVSALNEEGNRYLTLDGVEAVYEIAGDNVSLWAGVSVFSLQDALSLMPMITDIETMTLEVGGKTYQFRQEREEDTASSTEEKTVYTYTVFNEDGEERTYENFQRFYMSLITSYLIEDYREMPEGEPYLKCTYTYYESDETNTIEYYQMSDRRFCVVEDGTNVKGLVSNENLERAVEYLELLNNGETVPEVY